MGLYLRILQGNNYHTKLCGIIDAGQAAVMSIVQVGFLKGNVH